MQGRGPNGGGGFEERQKVRVIMRKKKSLNNKLGGVRILLKQGLCSSVSKSEFFFGNLTL